MAADAGTGDDDASEITPAPIQPQVPDATTAPPPVSLDGGATEGEAGTVGQEDDVAEERDDEADAATTSCQASAEVCDGVDNDCDGVPDDGLFNECGAACTVALASKPGTPCDNGQLGACRRTGVFECDPDGQTTCNAQSVKPGVCRSDVKDGIDNNCNGQIDEVDTTGFTTGISATPFNCFG